MIGSLRGVVLDRCARRDGTGEVIVETNGVGYRTVVPGGALPRYELGEAAFVHVHTHVREDALILYAFLSRDERDCFEVLLAAHGVGPTVALALLSTHTPLALRRIVAEKDTDALTLVPGIGKKTAARMLVELETKLVVDDIPDLSVVGADGGANQARAEVRAALAELGYGADEVRAAVGGLPEEGEVEDMLRAALRQLAVAR